MARRGRRREAGDSPIRAPYIDRKIGPLPVLSQEGLELIEANADRILSETGMEFHDDPEILEIFARAGCDVEGTRVRFTPGFCRRTITATAPSTYIQQARNPEKSVQVGGSSSVLCPSWGPPFVQDLDRGRRYAAYTDFVDLVKLHHTIPWLHHSGGVVCEPVDLPANKRHLDMLYAHIRWSDRPFMGAFFFRPHPR